MKQIFKVRVRQYATGEILALSHHEMGEEGCAIDDAAATYDIDESMPFHEFDLVVSATPPSNATHADVEVDVPDGAESVDVDVPDPVAA